MTLRNSEKFKFVAANKVILISQHRAQAQVFFFLKALLYSSSLFLEREVSRDILKG